jgi:YD repeat-containing protein
LRRPLWPARTLWPLTAAFLLLLPRLVAAQQPQIYYVYDDLNRLSAVVDQQGNAAAYVYDAVGNLLRVDRTNASSLPGLVGITLLGSTQGRIGATVQIFGKGFSPTASQNTVVINGVTATVTAAAPNRLVVTVPSGATTGPITVTTPLGSASSATPYTVLGVLTITPTRVQVFVTKTVQFQALDGGVPTTNVRWAVNGITGGDPPIGTITPAGVYQAPATLTAPITVTVTATNRSDSTLTASATVTVLPPQPASVSTPAVSVQFAPPPVTVNQSVRGAVSVAIAAARPSYAATAVSVAFQPVITGVAPAAGPRGSTMSVTLTGAGFTGATAVNVLLNNAADANVTVSNLVVDGSGTHATFTLTIAVGAAPGGRVLEIVTPGGTSTPAGIGGDIFTVQ